jgi:hypothetical protein
MSASLVCSQKLAELLSRSEQCLYATAGRFMDEYEEQTKSGK